MGTWVLNHRRWYDNCETVIASHFFSAILHGRLSVCIRRIGGDGSVNITELDGDGVGLVLSKIKDGKRPRVSRGEILSGRHTWQSFLAVRDSNLRIEPIELSNGDRVSVYVHTGDVVASSVALIRSDMLVARHDTMLVHEFDNLRKSDDVSPFALVIDVNRGQAGKELFDLVKSAEGPYHNRLTRGELSRSRERRLRELLDELAERIRECLPKIDRKGFDLQIFNSTAASVNKDREAKPVVEFGIGAGGKGKQVRKSGNGGSGRSSRFGRPADANIEARTEPTGRGWRIHVRVTPTNDTQAKDQAVLAFAIAEDRDNGIAGGWLTPEEVLVDGCPGSVEDGIVSLGQLTHSSPVVVEAALARPLDSAKGITAGVLSLLSLKREPSSKAADGDTVQAEPK